MPPPMVRIFLPCQSSRGKLLPYGPRTVILSPGSSWCRARVTLPMRMTEKRRKSPSVGEQEMQNMLSPAPRTPAMAHCPGRWLQLCRASGSSRVTLKVLTQRSPAVSSQVSSTVAVYGI